MGAKGGSYLFGQKIGKKSMVGRKRKWTLKRVPKRVCQTNLLINQFFGLEYQVRNGKVLSRNEMIRKKHQLIIKRTFSLSHRSF